MTTIVALSLVSALALHVAQRATESSAARRRFVARERTSVRDLPIVRRATARVLRGRHERVLEASLPDALDAIARSLRSGGSLRQAVDEAGMSASGALAGDLRRVGRSASDGVPLNVALETWALERPLPGVRLTVAALALGAETGGASAQAIDGVAATLRGNLAIAGEVRALSSQARLSALVIALAPIAFTLLAASTDGRTAGFLLRSPAGALCLVAGVGLDAIGWLWMRRITAVVA